MHKSRDQLASSSLEDFRASLGAARARLTSDRDECQRMHRDISDMDSALSRMESGKTDLQEVIEGIESECSRLSHLIERRRVGASAQKAELDTLFKPRIEEEQAAAKAATDAALERSTFSAHVCSLSTQLLDEFITTDPIDVEDLLNLKQAEIDAAEKRMEVLAAELKAHLAVVEEEERAILDVAGLHITPGEKRPREENDEDEGALVVSDGATTDAATPHHCGGHRCESQQGLAVTTKALSLQPQIDQLRESHSSDRKALDEDVRSLTVSRDTLRQELRTLDKNMSSYDEENERAQQRLVMAMDRVATLVCKSCGGNLAAREDENNSYVT